MSIVSLQVDLYMICEDQVFVANAVLIDLMRKIVASNVISRIVGVVTELNIIPNIRKYRRFHEGHHVILMTMEVHGAHKCDMDRFIRGMCPSFP
jgi:hypothetical protein